MRWRWERAPQIRGARDQLVDAGPVPHVVRRFRGRRRRGQLLCIQGLCRGSLLVSLGLHHGPDVGAVHGVPAVASLTRDVLNSLQDGVFDAEGRLLLHVACRRDAGVAKGASSEGSGAGRRRTSGRRTEILLLREDGPVRAPDPEDEGLHVRGNRVDATEAHLDVAQFCQ